MHTLFAQNNFMTLYVGQITRVGALHREVFIPFITAMLNPQIET